MNSNICQNWCNSLGVTCLIFLLKISYFCHVGHSAFAPCIMCVQYHGEYHEYHGGCHDKYGDILSTMGILSAMGGYHNTCRRYLECLGGVHYHGGYNLLLFEYPMVLLISRTCIMISPTVLNTPIVLKISLHRTRDIPTGY